VDTAQVPVQSEILNRNSTEKGKLVMAFKIPSHLRPDTAKWVRGILADFSLESHHFRILVKAAEAFDRSEQAREILAAEGIVTKDRFGTARAHPAVAIERDSRTAFLRAVRELALDVDSPDAPRPPRTKEYAQ
jgi:hypothetical protein